MRRRVELEHNMLLAARRMDLQEGRLGARFQGLPLMEALRAAVEEGGGAGRAKA